MKKVLNVAVIGTGMMGKMHSSAWIKVNKFFNADCEINLKVICDNKGQIEPFATQWGYDEVSYDWEETISRSDIDIVSICTPTNLHKEMSITAAKCGKHIVCEKPCSLTYTDCLEMAEAANKAGVVHYLDHYYRRVPAVAFAKQLVQEGRLGTIYHWRGAYLQDWIMDPNFPLTWHLRKEIAGGGPLYDLSSHALDLARYIIGEPFSVMCMTKTFINERPLPGRDAATFSSGSEVSTERGTVTVEDAAFMILDFENGVLGSIDSSRFATARRNFNDFEIYGSKGALKFNFLRMNELQYLDATEPATIQGYRNILITEPEHPYLKAWWPRGHVIGYEHTFANAFYDFVQAISNKNVIRPNLEDGANIIRVLQAAEKSSIEGRRVRIDEIN